MRSRSLTTLGALAATLVLASCGSESVQTNIDNGPLKGEKSAVVLRGAHLFAERCSGCHTLAVAGTQGGAAEGSRGIKERERTDGPDFNYRAETTGNVLYALRNGGFSGAIMPANIAVGDDADAIAAFLCKYSGLKAESPATPEKVVPAEERCADTGPPTPDETGDDAPKPGQGEGDQGTTTTTPDAGTDTEAAPATSAGR